METGVPAAGLGVLSRVEGRTAKKGGQAGAVGIIILGRLGEEGNHALKANMVSIATSYLKPSFKRRKE